MLPPRGRSSKLMDVGPIATCTAEHGAVRNRCLVSGFQELHSSLRRTEENLAGLMMSGQGGLRKLDVGVLSAEQQEKLRQFKITTRIDNEEYLKSHPEVQLLIDDFLRHVLLKRPDDIREFAADHFTNSNLRSSYDSKREVNKDME